MNDNSNGSGLSSGTIIGTLHDMPPYTPHVHLEVRYKGAWVRPENYFCN
jgi:hypothetical protein